MVCEPGYKKYDLGSRKRGTMFIVGATSGESIFMRKREFREKKRRAKQQTPAIRGGELGNLQESQDQAAEDAQTDNGPASNLDLLVGQALAKIPHQVSQSVEAVVGEREASNELGEDLEGSGPGGESGSDRGALDVPAKGGGNQVGETKDVEGSGEGDAGDTVESGAVPGDLRTVDAQVRSNGAVQALLGQDLLRGLRVGDGLEGGVSAVGRVSELLSGKHWHKSRVRIYLCCIKPAVASS